MLLYILYALFILACIVLILSVLLQPGKADAGALFTSSVSSTAFGPRGTQTLLAKITIISAAAFMLTALMLALGVGRPRSVMEATPVDTGQTQTQPSPATPQTSPATTQASPAGDNATAPAGATPASNTNANTSNTNAPASNTNTNTSADTNANTSASPVTAASPQGQQSPQTTPQQ